MFSFCSARAAIGSAHLHQHATSKTPTVAEVQAATLCVFYTYPVTYHPTTKSKAQNEDNIHRNPTRTTDLKFIYLTPHQLSNALTHIRMTLTTTAACTQVCTLHG